MEQIQLLRYAIETLEQLNLPYAVVGSFASGAYGEPRFTQDIDIVFEILPAKSSDFASFSQSRISTSASPPSARPSATAVNSM